jgi:hypothetical protein
MRRPGAGGEGGSPAWRRQRGSGEDEMMGAGRAGEGQSS